VKLATFLHLLLRLRMRGAIPPFPQYVFMTWFLIKNRDFTRSGWCGSQVVKKFTVLMDPKGLLPCSEEPTIGPYPEPDESSPWHHACKSLSWIRIFPPFTETEVQLLCSQEPVTGPVIEPDTRKQCPYPHNVKFNSIFPSTFTSPKWSLSLRFRE